MSEKRLHVLQVTGTMNRGGAEVMLMDIFRNIDSEIRFDFLVQTKKKRPGPTGDFDDEIRALGGRFFYIESQWDIGLIRYVHRFKKIIHEIGTPDVVHIHLNAKCGVIALAAKMCGIKKIIAHSHAALNFTGPLLRVMPSKVELAIQRILIGWCATDYWGCSSAANRSLFNRRAYARKPPFILSNAVDVRRFQTVDPESRESLRRNWGAGERTLILGNVGRVVRHKKVDFIVEVLSVIKKKTPDVLLVFAGREDDREFMAEIYRKAADHSVKDAILHLGDRGDIPEVMSAMDVFVGPALNEGFGLVAAEAQAGGLPCVLSRGFPDTVDMGLDLVTYLGVDDPVVWATAVLEMREKRRSDSGNISARILNQGYDAVANTREVEKLYREEFSPKTAY